MAVEIERALAEDVLRALETAQAYVNGDGLDDTELVLHMEALDELIPRLAEVLGG